MAPDKAVSDITVAVRLVAGRSIILHCFHTRNISIENDEIKQKNLKYLLGMGAAIALSIAGSVRMPPELVVRFDSDVLSVK